LFTSPFSLLSLALAFRFSSYGVVDSYKSDRNSVTHIDMDTIFVKNIYITAVIGLDCWHREKEQPALVTVRVPKKVEKVGKTDNIVDTLDYRPIYKTVTGLQTEKVYRSLPDFAKEICNRVSQLTETASLEVTVLLPKAVRQADGVKVEMRMQSTKGFGPSQTMYSEIYVIKGLRIECFIGIGEHERKEKQPVLLDLELRGSPDNFDHRDYQFWLGTALHKVDYFCIRE
jgi:FolB domain-containing protein